MFSQRPQPVFSRKCRLVFRCGKGTSSRAIAAEGERLPFACLCCLLQELPLCLPKQEIKHDSPSWQSQARDSQDKNPNTMLLPVRPQRTLPSASAFSASSQTCTCARTRQYPVSGTGMLFKCRLSDHMCHIIGAMFAVPAVSIRVMNHQ